MAAPDDRSPLALIAALARRGEDDLQAVAALARGEDTIDPNRIRGLVRAGLLRGGDHPRVPARLLLPALALDAALGLSGEQLLSQLVSLLCAAHSPSGRDLLLGCLQEELQGHLDALAVGPPPQSTEPLNRALAALRDTLASLTATDADPSQVTAVAALCARLIARLADTLAPARRTAPRHSLPSVSVEDLAATVRGLAVRSTRVLRAPSPAALAAAIAPSRQRPPASGRRAQLPAGAVAVRAHTVRAALRARDPIIALYAGCEAHEALARHATLIAVARDLQTARLQSSAAVRLGPEPALDWSTELARQPAIAKPHPEPQPARARGSARAA